MLAYRVSLPCLLIASLVAAPPVLQAAGPAEAPAVPLAEKLPSGAIGYFGWAGRSLTFDGSMFGQLLQEKFISEIAASIQQHAEDSGSQEAIGMIRTLVASPVAVGVYQGLGGPEVALVVQPGKGAKDFQAWIQTLRRTGQVEEDKRFVTMGALRFEVLDTQAGPDGPEPRLLYASSGQTVWLVEGLGTAKRIGLLRPATSIQGDKTLRQRVRALTTEHLQMALHVNVPSLRNIVNVQAGPGRARINAMLYALGLAKVQSVTMTSSIVDKGFLTRLEIRSPAPHKGVLAALATDAIDPSKLEFLPADATLALAMQVEPDRILQAVLDQVPPDQAQSIREQMEMVKKQLGVDVPALLANLNGIWTICRADSYGGAMTGLAATMQVRNEDAFKADLARIEAIVDRMVRARGLPGLQVHKVGRLEIHYLPNLLPNSQMAVGLAWAVHKGRFYLSPWPQVVQTAIHRAESDAGRSLTARPEYQRIRSKLPEKVSLVTWADYPSSLRRGYGIFLLLNSVLSGRMGQNVPGLEFQATWLPALSTLEKYIWPSVTVLTHDETGIRLSSYGSLPLNVGPMDLSTTPLAVSILLPSIARARSLAARAASQAQVSGLIKGVYLYAADNNGRSPQSLTALVDGGYASIEMLYSPKGDAPKDPAMLRRLKPQPDYVYLRPTRVLDNAPGAAVMIFEHPENYAGEDGTVVGYVSGHVEWVSMRRFRELMRNARPGAARDF